MKLHEQVCTKEQSRRLAQLGIKQESEFYYTGTYGLKHVSAPASWGMEETIGEYVSENINYPAYEIFSAFTVAELGELLPERVLDDGKWQFIDCEHFKSTLGYRCWISSARTQYALQDNYKTEAEARAAMIIYLLENGLLNNTD